MTDTPETQTLRRIAIEAAENVSEPLRQAFRSTMDVDTKTSHHDLVTIHDQQTEKDLIAALSAAVPDSRFTGEEGGSVGDGRLEWIIDPIDGTSNFAHGFAMFSISIAAAMDNTVVAGVVHDPVNQLTFSADAQAAYLRSNGTEEVLRPAPNLSEERHLNLVTSFPAPEMLTRHGDDALATFGEFVTTYASVRRTISGALELCHAAAGWADIAAGGYTNPWDVGAGQLILRQAGGRYLPFGARDGRSWDGEEGEDAHLAPGYVALAAGVQAPTAVRAFSRFAYRG